MVVLERDALGELRRNSPGRSSLLSRAGFSHWSNFARLDPKELPVVIDTNSHLIHKYNRLEAIPAMFATPREPSSLVCVRHEGLNRREQDNTLIRDGVGDWCVR